MNRGIHKPRGQRRGGVKNRPRGLWMNHNKLLCFLDESSGQKVRRYGSNAPSNSPDAKIAKITEFSYKSTDDCSQSFFFKFRVHLINYIPQY